MDKFIYFFVTGQIKTGEIQHTQANVWIQIVIIFKEEKKY